ncbi:MAG: hypothetical protein U5L01_02290 [Rheinheimera sp.]|nr:hypothetical protein [Rheinheimera sp.]
MQLLQVISLLLDYPTEDLTKSRQEIVELISKSSLSETCRQALLHFVQQRFNGDLMEWQADYDSLFERGRSLSLLLFEHLHGESATVVKPWLICKAQYKSAGLEISLEGTSRLRATLLRIFVNARR